MLKTINNIFSVKKYKNFVDIYPAIIICISLYVFILLVFFNKPDPIDDAYITLTYCKNIVTGKGFVFNEGERVLGSTTPLYILLISGLKLIFSSIAIPVLALRVNALCLCISSMLLYLIMLNINKGYAHIGLLTAILFSFNQCLLSSVLGCMESHLLITLTLFSFFLTIKRKEKTCGIILALALLTRPEGLISAISVLTTWIIVYRRIPYKLILSFFITILPWFVFSLLYFESVVPHNIIVKLQTFLNISAYPNKMLENLSTVFSLLLGQPPIRGIAIEKNLWGTTISYWTIISIIFFLFCAISYIAREKFALLFISYVLFYLIFHGFSNTLYFGWYIVPLVPLVLIIYLGGIYSAIFKKSKSSFDNLRVIALVLLVIWMGEVSFRKHVDLRLNDPCGLTGHTKEPEYIKAAEYLNKIMEKKYDVAIPEVGAFGFYTNHHVIDLVGLVSKEVLPLRKAYNKNYWLIAKEFNPKWIVTDKYYLHHFTKSDDFYSKYHQIKKFNRIILFERNI